jgi:hypothetical protein
MSRRGRVVTFHGMFTSRAAAQRKQKKVHRSYVKKVKHRKRWLVLTR